MVSFGRKQRLTWALAASTIAALAQASALPRQLVKSTTATDSMDTAWDLMEPNECLDSNKPCPAQGDIFNGPEPIPSPVKMSCRVGYKNDRAVIGEYGSQMFFRVFLGSKDDEFHDWCRTLEEMLKARCGQYGHVMSNLYNFRWVRCGPDSRDPAVAQGTLAIVMFPTWTDQVQACMAETIGYSVDGKEVDWLRHDGCWEEPTAYNDILEVDGEDVKVPPPPS